jgi:hypothetical protein
MYLLTLALVGVMGQIHTSTVLPQCPLDGRLGGPWTWSGCCGKEKKFPPPTRNIENGFWVMLQKQQKILILHHVQVGDINFEEIFCSGSTTQQLSNHISNTTTKNYRVMEPFEALPISLGVAIALRDLYLIALQVRVRKTILFPKFKV